MKKSYFGSYIIAILIILVCLFYMNYWFKNSEGLNYNWALQPQIDYPGPANDITNYNIKGSDCMTKCFDTKGCVGIVTDKRWATDVGQCWLKSSLKSNVKVSATNPKRFTWVKP